MCHVIFASAILLLLQLGLTSGLQQRSPISTTVFPRQPISFQQQSTSLILWSAAADNDLSDFLAEDKQKLKDSYDWDEQFEELQAFLSEYGHCNFPQNPPIQLNKKYPLLKRFCHDQRVEYTLTKSWKKRGDEKMSLVVFDRAVRCCRLEELGFEFNPRTAKWYDHYHELMQYGHDNGHIRIAYGMNYDALARWVQTQRHRRSDLLESQIKLLDDIGFEWKVYDELWDATYQELLAFRNEHGHFMVEYDDPLYRWMKHQRRRRAPETEAAALTDEQIRLLDDIEFPWNPDRYDSKWYSMYDELQRFQKRHGHCQPGPSTHGKLYKWSITQQSKHEKGFLSSEQIKRLDKLGFPWERKRNEWPKMFGKLSEYSNTHGHVHVNQDDDPDLYDWMTIQRQRYHGTTIPHSQIERLEELHFCWSLDWRECTWHEKYTEMAEFFKEHGHVRVTKKENLGLYNWIETQGKRYKELKGQKPLSEEELEMLEQIDFAFFDDQPRMAWNAMYAEVGRYREENDGRFPTKHKDDAYLNRWMRQQRHRYRQAYGYVPLSDEQKSLLESVDFPMYPESRALRLWYERYDQLVDFWKQHGHFLVDKNKDLSLEKWLNTQREKFNGNSSQRNPLLRSQVYLLERVRFPWVSDRSAIIWQRNYEEVVEFLELRGHFPGLSDNPKLARWLTKQRAVVRGNKGVTSRELSEDEIQRLDKIGFQW